MSSCVLLLQRSACSTNITKIEILKINLKIVNLNLLKVGCGSFRLHLSKLENFDNRVNKEVIVDPLPRKLTYDYNF